VSPFVLTRTCTEPDDLGFLAMWKRLMTRKQQLAADAETARAASQQLRSTVSQLQERLREEGMGKQAAVAAKAELEERLQDAERERDHWQVSWGHIWGSNCISNVVFLWACTLSGSSMCCGAACVCFFAAFAFLACPCPAQVLCTACDFTWGFRNLKPWST
jgi:hypothetical protein